MCKFLSRKVTGLQAESLLNVPSLNGILIWQALVADNSQFDSSRNVLNPVPAAVTGIPDCTGNLYLTKNCYDFVYAPNNNAIINVRLRYTLAPIHEPRTFQVGTDICISASVGTILEDVHRCS